MLKWVAALLEYFNIPINNPDILFVNVVIVCKLFTTIRLLSLQTGMVIFSIVINCFIKRFVVHITATFMQLIHLVSTPSVHVINQHIADGVALCLDLDF